MNKRVNLAEEREDLRAHLLSAAISVFGEEGFRGASTQAIADRAGISKTKLHYHIAKIWSDLFSSVSLGDGPEVFLRSYIYQKFRFSIEHPDEVRMFANDVKRGAKMLREQWAGSYQATQGAAERINGWVDEGLIRKIDPVLLQIHIWALTEQYAVMNEEIRYMLDMN